MVLKECDSCSGTGEVGMDYSSADACPDCLGVGQVLLMFGRSHNGGRARLGTTKVATYIEYAAR